jgi:diacylglycerol kinase (ATP)
LSRGRLAEVKSLAKSFRNAIAGVAYCIKNERNMRIHLTVTAYVLVFSAFYHLTGTEYILLAGAICLVLFAEAVNTAIEAVVNMHTQCYDSLARIAKDVAAGAVLICAVVAAVIGCILFLKPDILLKIIDYLFTHLLWGGLFLVSLPVSAIFIFYWPRKVRTVMARSRWHG